MFPNWKEKCEVLDSLRNINKFIAMVRAIWLSIDVGRAIRLAKRLEQLGL